MLYWFDLMGVGVFAVSGALAAMRAGLDLFGLLVLAAITAIGGGTLRDLLLNRHPLFWMKDGRYLAVIVLAALATLLSGPLSPSALQALKIADALGLALFALCGAEIAEDCELPPVPVLLMGTLTATGGGVVRDLLSGQVPLLLRQDIYATAALAGIALYQLLMRAGLARNTAFVLGMVSVATLRLLSLHYGWQLPVPQLPS
ncbi:trimeric intracellular cation channel family protein [Paucibacter sp. APW11]|uniref:Trimeric intracellular cation channel family protein n=1 Tax=Roseateles aquae TaxID=3077235 RepID=A0ABU3PI21_9BURK|nr:trimeric intracellular cation channel family protein [Paucibacter sp. APW11]MDT9002192.1 trimeric intracellular cation channel family protein [Paucibacter sp. APW11]